MQSWDEVNLQQADMTTKRCRTTTASLNDAIMYEVNLQKANLSNSSLQRAKFIDPDIPIKDAKGANLNLATS